MRPAGVAGRLTAAAAFAGAVGVCVTACGRGAPSPAAAPDRDAAGAGSSATLTVTVDGKPRTVVVYAPASARAPAPLVLNLHGSGGTAAGEEAYSGMDRAADAYGFIAAYPQGAIALAAGYAWNVPGQLLVGNQPVPTDAADDLAFLRQAVQAIERAYGVDDKRVYAAGFSGGGRMVSQLGCDLPDVIAAVAAVAGLRYPSPCAGARPVPVVAFHGTADAVNPYDGGGEAYWTYGVADAAQAWAAHDGCPPAPARSPVDAGVELTSYAGCSAGAAVDLYTIDGWGHAWPGAPGQPSAVDATDVMWRFFAAHPL
ncbi:MAG TPA: PHB depolymerase family esterase [Polyangiaceae bacterium]|nr:PHB depolymerase family esterase [Polyangiaceae bacterium]